MTSNFQNQIVSDVDKCHQHTQIYSILSVHSKHQEACEEKVFLHEAIITQ